MSLVCGFSVRKCNLRQKWIVDVYRQDGVVSALGELFHEAVMREYTRMRDSDRSALHTHMHTHHRHH